MAAQQFIVGAYDQLIAALEAHVAFISLIRVGNRIDWTTGQAVVKKYAIPNKAPVDYPRFELAVGGSVDTGFDLTPHYGMRTKASSISSLAWTERETHAFKLRISTNNFKITSIWPLIDEAKTAIRKYGPRLRLDSVFKREGMTVSDPFEDVDSQSGRTMALSTEITIPVTFQFNGQDLIT